MKASPRTVGLGLAGANLFFWAFWILMTPPLPADYFAKRDARVKRVDGAIQRHFMTDVDPMLILAERPFMEPWVRPHPLLWGGLLVNLPAFVTGGLSTALLDGLTVPPYRSTRVAAWLGTAVFFLVATVQWIVLGILGTRITKWVLSRRTAWR